MELVDPQEYHDALKEKNQQDIHHLATEGMQIPHPVFTDLYLQSVVDFLIGDDPQRKLELETLFQKRVADMVKDAQSQVAKAKLTNGMGMHPTAKLHIVGDAPPPHPGQEN